MFRQIGLVAGLAVCALAPSAGLAQVQKHAAVGEGVMTPESNYTHRDVGAFVQEFDNRRLNDRASALAVHEGAGKIAECIIRRSGDKAGSYLGGELAGDADFSRLGKVLNGKLRNCTVTDQGAPALIVNGVLAEQLLSAETPTFEDRAADVQTTAAREFFGDLTGQVTFDNIAGCLAVYSPGLTYKLLQTEVGSEPETAALAALFAQSPECHMPAPPTSTISAIEQRAALSTALYEWTNRQS